MEGFSSNLNDTFTSTRGCAEPVFFPQHILPLLPLYNAQWWGYKSLTAIVLVFSTLVDGSHPNLLIFSTLVDGSHPNLLILSLHHVTCICCHTCLLLLPSEEQGSFMIVDALRKLFTCPRLSNSSSLKVLC